MDKQALSVVVMAVGLVAVDRDQREQGDQLQTLAQYIGNTAVSYTHLGSENSR